MDWDAKTKGKAVLAELLTRHLLTLDGIKAQGYRETAPHVRPQPPNQTVYGGIGSSAVGPVYRVSLFTPQGVLLSLVSSDFNNPPNKNVRLTLGCGAVVFVGSAGSRGCLRVVSGFKSFPP